MMGRRRHTYSLRGLAALLCLTLAMWPRPVARAASPAPAGGPASLHGRVVTFARNGYEPDGDPVDRVIIAARLHDRRRVPVTLPDTTLVLSTYLENFQTATVPILPDLLQKDVTATSLGGFIQGKAALVDDAGHVRYKGGVLAETFFDNTVHMVADMDPQGMPATVPSLRLSGIFALSGDKANPWVDGSLRLSRSLSSSERAALYVARPRPVSWRAVVATMRVRYPRMMGTGGAARLPSTASSLQSATPVASRQTGGPVASGSVRRNGPSTSTLRRENGGWPVAPLGEVAIALLALIGGGLWWRRRGAKERASNP